jgi:hypothetical protein
VVEQPARRPAAPDGHQQRVAGEVGPRLSAIDQPTISRVAMSLMAAR